MDYNLELVKKYCEDAKTRRTSLDDTKSGYVAQVSKLPNCDFCGKVAVYDARTKITAWAFMCEWHFMEYGIGLGWGNGQKLEIG